VLESFEIVFGIIRTFVKFIKKNRRPNVLGISKKPILQNIINKESQV